MDCLPGIFYGPAGFDFIFVRFDNTASCRYAERFDGFRRLCLLALPRSDRRVITYVRALFLCAGLIALPRAVRAADAHRQHACSKVGAGCALVVGAEEAGPKVNATNLVQTI